MDESTHFENEVRRIAGLKWPSAIGGGKELISNRERDGVYITEECVHLLECTTSRALSKAEHDLQKLFDLYREMHPKYPDRAFKCWFITLEEPTDHQRNARTKFKGTPPNLFIVESFEQFRSKLVDAHQYLSDRIQHRFGSVCDPTTDDLTKIATYVDVPVRIAGSATPHSVHKVAERLNQGDRLCVLGEFGIGKSMMLREVFLKLRDTYRQKSILPFPIHLNLREHQGQQLPAEILERHARTIGFANPQQLVRAWRSGLVTLLLDGFDEVSSTGLQGAWRRLREARRASAAGIRKLIEETPASCGMIVAGRSNFFDSVQERRESLGMLPNKWSDVRLDDFDEEQIQQLAKKCGFNGSIPSWIPSRPLFVATLFARTLTPTVAAELSQIDDPATGWDLLLDEICAREARIESGVSGQNLRAILESLATQARVKDGGLGPVFPVDIVEVFKAICGFEPTDEALIVLQRLPGLGSDSRVGSDARMFVDSDFADACRAGDVVRYCSSPFDFDGNQLFRAIIPLGATGVGVAIRRLRDAQFSPGEFNAALKGVNKALAHAALAADLISIALRFPIAITQSIAISDIRFESMSIEYGRSDLSHVTYSFCFIDNLDMDDGVSKDSCPVFHDCLIGRIDGAVSLDDLPLGCFDGVVIESFAGNTITTNSVLDLPIPIGVRVLVTILRKLFVQSITGRKEDALYRGLDGRHQLKVESVLELLRRDKMATTITRQGEAIWIPVRRQRGRVLAILGSPTTSSDRLVIEARSL